MTSIVLFIYLFFNFVCVFRIMSTFISTVNMTILGCFVQHELTIRRELDWQAIWLIVNRLLSLWDELHKSNIVIHIRFSPKCQCLFNRLCLREYSIQWAFLYNCVHFLQFKHNKPGRDLFSPPHAVWERGFSARASAVCQREQGIEFFFTSYCAQ